MSALPKLYQFADLNHWETFEKNIITGQQLVEKGHRVAGYKASDNYHLPDKDGKYNFAADWHIDAFMLDSIRSYQEAGLAWFLYHFARWDRPIGSRTVIVQKNFEYFMRALAHLRNAGVITEEVHDNLPCACFDAEQNGEQLKKAGLKKADVSSMLKDMLEPFLERFPNVIFYSGSWWVYEWVDDKTMEWIAERTTCWEPQYDVYLSNDGKFMPDFAKSRWRDYDEYFEKSLTLPPFYKKEFALTAADAKGKLLAHQYTAQAKIMVKGHWIGTDYNLSALDKEEWFKFTGIDGAVVPPPEPPAPPPVNPPPTPYPPVETQLDRIEKKVDALLARK